MRALSAYVGTGLCIIRYGIKAVTADNAPKHPFLSGEDGIDNYEKGRTGAEEGPQTLPQPYALLELSRLQKVGAALSSALSRFDAIVKQNPDNLVRQESGRSRKSSLPGRQSGTPGSVVA